MLRALARVDLGAIERNARRLAAVAGPAALCAVVKADAYGHGMVPAARAAQAGGASWLAVATAEEARGLRAGGIEGPLLVMGALSAQELAVAVAARADVVAWREAFVERRPRAPASAVRRASRGVTSSSTRAWAAWARATPARRPASRRRSPLAGRCALAGAMTHFATADDDPAFLAEQLAAFTPWAHAVKAAHPGRARPRRQLGAATLREPAARFDLVRCGIAVYGMDPFQADPAAHDLEPALALVSYVAEVKEARPGRAPATAAASWPSEPTWLGTLPIGYGDGVRRGADQQRRRAGRGPPRAARRHGLDGQHHGRPRRGRRRRPAPRRC